MKRSEFRFEHVQARRRFPGRKMLPSGARIFYYTRRFLLAKGVLPAVYPDEAILPALVVEHFLQKAPFVSERLALEFARAVRLRAEPGLELMRLFSTPFSLDPDLPWIPAHPGRSQEEIQRLCERLRETCWGEADQDHVARLCTTMLPACLSVAPVARPEDPPKVALRLLRDQLAQDTEQGWLVPHLGAYLYDEFLETWLLRFL